MKIDKFLTCNIVLIALLVLSSCSQTIKDFYDDGSIKREYHLKKEKYDGAYKEYYTNGNLKLLHNYKNGRLVDSSLFYNEKTSLKIDYIRYYSNDGIKEVVFDNGVLLKEGFVNDKNIGIGKWKFYNKKGLLEIVREYKIINNEQYLNQSWSFNKKGDTVYGGNFCKIDVVKDTISLLEPFRAVAYLYVPLFENANSEATVCLPYDENVNFDKNFSNDGKIQIDTFYNLKKDIKNQQWFPNNNPNYTVVFGKKFKTSGKKIIRGYVLEFYENNNDSINREERKIYFEKEVYVKDVNLNVPTSL
ncbi:hypothetical protein [uncultured Algibacter sp.]|uniref:toxin-antitoxin system YwqK family antitoxin n=1 Tax=uncultured Algibacter sp. TaxID=298659 RepID=UPI0026063BB1|nr:hypothetical protein [uncultured Algibacter sp.]